MLNGEIFFPNFTRFIYLFEIGAFDLNANKLVKFSYLILDQYNRRNSICAIEL